MNKFINRLLAFLKKPNSRNREQESEWGAFFETIGAQDERLQLIKKIRIALHPDRFINDPEKALKAKELHSQLANLEYDVKGLRMLIETISREF